MELNKEFLREEIYMIIKYLIVLKIVLVMKEMQILIILKFYFILVRTVIKNNGNKCLCSIEYFFILLVKI